MAASFNRWAIVLLVFLCVPSVWAQRVGETSFCEDTGTCRVGEACVAGQCTQLSDNRIRRLFPLAIDRIVNLDAGSRRGPVVDRIRQLLRRYFAFSGYFTVVDADLNPPASVVESLRLTTIDFQAWYDAGAYAFVKGNIKKSDDQWVLTLHLFIAEEGLHEPRSVDEQRFRIGDSRALKHTVVNWVDSVITNFAGRGGALTQRIAFAHRIKRGGAKEIKVIDVDGESEHFITQNGSINMLPAWTRDGRVAYSSFLLHNPDLYVEGKKLSARPRMNTGASFHPNGKLLALTLSKDGNAEIYVISAIDGSIRRRLTRERNIDTSPSWSPDGKHLAFVSDRDTGRPQIYIMNANGAKVRRLPQVGRYNTSPDWSPSGDQIAYSSRVGGERYDIYVISVSTGVIQRVTSKGSNEEAHYSADGRYMVFSSTRNGGPHLWIMNSNGGAKRQLTFGPGEHLTPSWQR
ncbi:MAG TPA: hypothetical protein EYN06_04950 [Myxococcales bacterium]|nr:hypothetical protein [Myxococcales bacterium]HIN85810.1 hypothetical protein [Myxococcales bacterium]